MPDALHTRARQVLSTVKSVCPHTDADGLAAGAIALRAIGKPAAFATLLGRGQTPFGPTPPLPPGPAAVLDWGVRAFDRPGLIVDHHAPEAELSADQVLVSGYGQPHVSTAVLMRRICPDAPAWLAAVGAAGDYGDDGLKLPECAGVVKAHIKRLVPLINAPRRLPDGPVRDALALLVEHDSPKDALADERIELLEQAKLEWRQGFEKAVKTAPRIAGEIAVLRFSSPYQVHPLVATTWNRRLAPKVVIAANDNYLPGMVNFAARGGPDGLDLRKLLRDALPDVQGEFAHGHDKATGGSLSFADFERLMRGLGF